MSGTSVEPIYIRAASKSNGITSLVLGCIGLFIFLLNLCWFEKHKFLTVFRGPGGCRELLEVCRIDFHLS